MGRSTVQVGRPRCFIGLGVSYGLRLGTAERCTAKKWDDEGPKFRRSLSGLG